MKRVVSAALVWRAIIIALGAIIVLGAATTLSGAATPAGASSAAVQAQCSAPAWNSGSYYLAGDVVSHNGHEWQANQFAGAGMEPGNSGFPPWWVPWADLGPCGSDGNPPGDSVDEFYSASGEWAVTTETVNIPEVGSSTIYRPADLGADGFQHPVVTWGNGAFQSTGDYDALLTHLASWGYVVVSPNTGQVDPPDMIAAAEWVVTQNSNSSSPFSGNLDTDNIAAVGHSRGSSGAILAQTRSNGLIGTSVAIDTPDRVWWDSASDYQEIGQTESVFFVAGTDDFLTSQGDHQWFFNQAGGAAAVGATVGDDHFAIQQANNAKLGYITAWLDYTLQGDELARTALVGSPPEIEANPGWAWQMLKNLP